MKKISSILVVCLLVGLLTNCSKNTAALVGTWSEESYQMNGFKKMLVIGLSDNVAVRKYFEDSMKKALKSKKNMVTLGSLDVLPSDMQISKENLDKYIEDEQIDAVLVTRSVADQQEATYKEGERFIQPLDYRYSSYSYYFRQYYRPPDPSGYQYTRIVKAETSLFETEGGKLVWACQSKSFREENTEKVLNDLSKLVVHTMTQEGVIK